MNASPHSFMRTTSCFHQIYARWALDETWGYEKGITTGDSGVVCDWTGVKQDSLDMPSCVKGVCGGHNAEDTLPFEIKVCFLCGHGCKPYDW